MFSSRGYFAIGLAAIPLGLALSAPIDAQPAYRVKDIQTNVNVGVGLNPYGFETSGSLVYFVGSDLVHGQEPWRTDGTSAGTFMLRDFVPGDAFSPPGSMVDFGGTLFFAATDPVNGRELWKSDGTTAGTVLVKDIDPIGGSLPQKLTAAGGMLFFEAYGSAAENRELWKSDGTAAGTVLLKDIRVGPAQSFVDHLTDVGGMLFFNANNGSLGKDRSAPIRRRSWS